MCQLRTKAMREKDETRERNVYKYTLIRIRFPDGLILQVNPFIIFFLYFKRLIHITL